MLSATRRAVLQLGTAFTVPYPARFQEARPVKDTIKLGAIGAREIDTTNGTTGLSAVEIAAR